MKKIFIIGSINADIVYEVNNLPEKGETINSNTKSLYCGGKGYNQAYAASKFNEYVYLCGKLGIDSNGKFLKKSFKNKSINVENILYDKTTPTGEAIILVDKNGDNLISVLKGTNGLVEMEDVVKFKEKLRDNIILMQMEIPFNTVKSVIGLKEELNLKIVLNLAPFKEIDWEILKKVDYLILNEVEASQLIKENISDYDMLIKNISRKLPNTNIVITLGSDGVIFNSNEKIIKLKAHNVDVIDTTGAGDTFVGVLAALLDKEDYETAIGHANVAAAISTTKLGAQSAMPNCEDVIGDK